MFRRRRLVSYGGWFRCKRNRMRKEGKDIMRNIVLYCHRGFWDSKSR